MHFQTTSWSCSPERIESKVTFNWLNCMVYQSEVVLLSDLLNLEKKTKNVLENGWRIGTEIFF